MSSVSHSRIRPLGRGTAVGGFFLTIALHAGLGWLVYSAHFLAPPATEVPRDMIVTKLVALGKPREKFWLPRIVVPPKPKAPAPTIKLSEDPNAAPTVKEAPKVEDPDISKNLRNALKRAQMLAAANSEDEPAEGSLSGSSQGTSTEGVTGDAYATAIYEAIKRNWVTPTGLITEAELATLSVEVRVSIHEDGTLANPAIKKSSGNLYFDDSCVQAIKSTGRVPPPPVPLRARFERGTLLDFRGSDLTH